MTLTIHSEEDGQRQLLVTIEVPEERVETQMRKTARTLARQLNIPGFRRGKVPYNVLVRRVGRDALRADAIEELMEPILVETLEQVEAEPYRQPTIEKMEMEPLVIEVVIPLEPQVTLGDYRAIRKELQKVEVTEEALADALEHLQSKHQTLEVVERPAEAGDWVTVSGEGRFDEEDGEVIWHEHGAELVLNPDKVFPGVPFVENIIGMSAGEQKTFNFSFPEEYEEDELAGKSAVFEITLSMVQSRELPELDDELAQAEGDYETVDELRKALREDLYEEAKQQSERELIDAVINDMLADAEMAYPPALVESELDNILESFKDQMTRSGWQWEDYLKIEGETEESIRGRWRENADERVQRGLILRQFIEDERLSVEELDIDAALEKRLERFGDNEELREQLRSIFTEGSGFEMMSNDILMEKVNERIMAIAAGTAPEIELIEEETIVASEEEE